MEHLRSQFYTSDPQKLTKEYHVEQSMQAVELLKAASRPDGWKKIDKHKSGCVVYQSTSAATIPGHGESKYPAFKGEHIIRGFKAQDVFSIVSVRKLWDDWYDELSCVEAYDEQTMLMYMIMKGTLSSKTRDIAMVERTVFEQDGTIYAAACSVESSKVPAVSGKVRAIIFLAGWIIQPLPSNPPITKITYVIQTDLLSRLPKFIAKRSLIKRALVIATIETYLRKNGVPASLASNARPANRNRSMSEPIRLDQFLLPEEEESDDDEPSGSAFGPMQSKHDLRHIDYNADSEDEDEDEPSSSWTQSQHQLPPQQRQGSEKAPTPATRHSLLSTKSLFSQEFLESNSFMNESTLFSDSSLLFGKGGIFESTSKKQEEAPPLPLSARPQPTHSKQQAKERAPERAPEKSPERLRPPPSASRTISPERETRKPSVNKRVSIPVVAPKSEARMRPFAGGNNNNSTNQLSVPESSTPMGLVTPDTPPLTPPASVDGKDGTSDSDAARSYPEVKVVPRTPKSTPEPVDTTSRPNSLAMSSLGMKSPSAMMEATTRRHSALLSRTAFVPRHSHVVPIRGNPNVSLQSLTRPSGPNGTMTTAMKRHSTAPSIDSSRSSTTFFTPMMVLPHRHSETARKALAMFKVLASSPEDRWRAISSENGFKSYSRVISGAGLPMLRGEGTITGGWTVEQINAVIESSGCRQVWDERFENMSIAETFNHNEYLFHITLRGVGSLTGRDLAGVTIVDRDPQTSALYNVSTSVLDPTIPEDPGRIRAMLELSGWSLRPTFDGQGNTVSVNVTFVIQIDIRGNLPSSVVKSMTSSMTMAVSRLNQFINKTGYPPFASHISGTRLLDTFEPKIGFYELCYKAAPGWTEVRIGRKVYKEGYDFFIKPDDPSVKVELAPDFGGVRVWTTLDHEGQSIIAQVSRKGQNAIVEPEVVEEQKQEAETKDEIALKSSFKDGVSRRSDIELDMRHSTPSSRKRRSASYATLTGNAQGHAFGTAASEIRPDSHASQFSERSRSRGRTPRSIVTLPAGTLPPPLPRRSSSLTRLSIPISEYFPEADAPPVPVNNVATGNSTATPTTATTMEASPSPRPASDSPLGSPTLGFFHIPVVPAVSVQAGSAALPLTAESKRTSTIVSSDPSGPPMESISAVLSESAQAHSAADAAPESNSRNMLTISAAEITSRIETVTVMTIQGRSMPAPSSPTAASPKRGHNLCEAVVSSLLSSQASPTNTPVPSPMAAAFGPRGSSLSSASTTIVPGATAVESSTALAAPATSTISSGFQPTSSLKNRTSSASLGGAIRRREVRVTFSLDTVDNSSSEELAKSSSPLDSIVKLNSSSSGNGSGTSSLAKEHLVKIVAAPHHPYHRTTVIEDTQSSEYESDEAEFVEARDELSEDELEFVMVLTSVGSWPSLSSISSGSLSAKTREEKQRGQAMVASSIKAVETGLRMVTTGSPLEVKVAIVFLLLVYYASRLASLIA